MKSIFTLTLLLLLGVNQSISANALIRWDFTSNNFLQQLELAAGKRFADPEVTIVLPVNGAESGSPTNGNFTLHLSSLQPEDITVTYAVAGTATEGADYTIQTSVVIPAGVQDMPLTISVLDDMILESGETVIVTLSGALTTSNVVVPVVGGETLTITDDDYTTVNRSVTFESFVNGEEGGNNASMIIALPGGYIAGEDITVNYSLTGGTTAGTTDYSPFALTAVIAAGTSSVTVPITITDDIAIEDKESLEITLNSATGNLIYGVGPQIGVVISIIDNDDRITISQIINGEEGVQNAGFYLSLPTGISTTEDIIINYSLSGAASNGNDYTTLSGTVTLPAGSPGVLLPVIVTDDEVIETTEEIIFSLNDASGATSNISFTIIPAANIATISDNDNTAANRVLTITTTTDGAEPNINGSFVISLPGNYTCSETMIIRYTVAGSAGPNIDYIRLSGNAILPADQHSTDPIPVRILDDLIIEGNETVIVTITSGQANPSGALFTPGVPHIGTVNIADNDNTDMGITVTASDPNAAEPGDHGSFTITLPGGKVASVPVTVNYTITGTAGDGTDFTTIPLSTIIPAGSPSVNVPVTVIDDNLIEGAETVVLTITNAVSAITQPAGFVAGTPAVATVTIADDDNTDMNVVATASDPNAAEPADGGEFRLSVAAGKQTSVPITVTYTITGTAVNGTDFTTIPLTAVIPAGQNNVSIPVSVIDDNLIEGAETIVLTITGVSAVITPPFTFDPARTAIVNIADNDDTNLNIVATASDASAKEPADNGEFLLSLAPGKLANVPVVVTYTLTGAAVNGTDYTSTLLTATIPAGQNNVAVSIPVLDDNLVEGNETVILTITGVDAPYTFNSTATVIIEDDDNTTVTIGDQDGNAGNGINGINAAEPSTNGGFTLSIAPGKIATLPILITYTITGTSSNGTDYTSLPLTATINAGNGSVNVPVTVIDDDLIEGNETVVLTINGITTTLPVTVGTQNSASIIIVDDETNMNVGVVDDDGDTGNGINGVNAAEPSTNGRFTVNVASGKRTSVPVTVTYTISGSAVNGTDYTTVSGSVTIAAGSNSANIPVTVIDDDLIEGYETMIITITGITATLPFIVGAQDYGGIIIADDDNTDMNVVATASDPNASEPTDGGEFRLSVAAGKRTSVPVTVTYTITGTAIDGTDFTTIPLTAVIPAGQNNVLIPVSVIDDNLIEGTETVILTITGVNGVITPPFTFDPARTAIVNIADNDDTNLNIVATASDANAKEPADNGEFLLSLAPGKLANVPIVVTYTLTGTAVNGTDYTSTLLTATIPVGQNGVPVSIPVLDDNLVEGNETVILTITGVDAPYTFNSTATVIIEDDDNTTVTIGDQDGNAGNGINGINAAEPSTNGGFTLSIAPGKITTLPIVITYTIMGTAADGTDYTSLPLTATISAGNGSVNVPVTVIDDDLIEGNETVVLTINGITTTLPVTVGTQNAASILIVDDETDMNVGVGDDDGDATNGINGVNAAEPSTNGRFTVNVAPGKRTSVPITVTYTISGTAVSGTDYTTVSGSVTIAAGSNSANIPVTVIDDNLIEGAETVIITITGITATLPFIVGTQSNAGIVIADDDNTDMNVVATASDPNASEPADGGEFSLSVAAGKQTSVPVTITYTITGTAVDGTDFTTIPLTAVIPAGQNNVLIPVSVIDDDLVEGAETVVLTITGVSGVITPPFIFDPARTAIVNISDNDDTNLNIVATASDASAKEPADNGEFLLSLAPGKLANVPIVVTYTLTGTAVNGTDYTSTLLTATIPVGQNGVPVSIPVLDDNLVEGNETVILTITGVDAPYTFNSTATVIIEDDDNTTVTIGDQDGNASNGINGINAAEPSTNGGFTLSIAPGKITTLPILITYTITGTSSNGTDYTSLPLTATIDAGNNSVDVPVTVIDDDLIEGNETVVLTINGITTTLPVTVGTQNAASILIVDDETDMNVGVGDDDGDATNGINGVNAAEPSTNGRFTVSVAPGKRTSVPITVTYTISGTAVSGTDYAAISGSVTIAAGSNSANIPVTVIDDNLIEGDETVMITITGITATLPFIVGTQNNAGIIIDDDDDGDMTVGPDDNDGDASNGINGVNVAEPNTNGGFTISVAPGKLTSVPITISYTLSGTSANGEDYVTSPAQVVIEAGNGSVEIPVNVIDDQLIEGDETVIITINSVTSTLPFTAVTETASINVGDDDIPVVDLLVTKSVVQPGPYTVGQDITYRITVTNNGNIPATEVVVTDSLPAVIEQDPVTTVLKGIVTQNGRILTWTIDQLEIGETLEMLLVCRVSDGGTLTNSATAVAKETEGTPTDNKGTSVIRVDGDALIIPNVFTPNGDGKNEKFDIGGLNKYPLSTLYVYNRWGAMVYQSRDYQNNWTGTGLSAGSYFYTLEVKKGDGVRIYKGWVEILR